MRRFIPLLSPMPFGAYSPESFQEYVKSLYLKRAPKVKRGAAPKKGYSARLNAKGTLIVTTKRKPKWLTQGEITEISAKLGRPENEVFLHVKEKGYSVMSHEEADEVRKALGELPW